VTKPIAATRKARAARIGAVAATVPDGVTALARAIAHRSWFAALGDPLTDAERAEVATYLAALGLDDCRIAGVATWDEARAIASAPDWDPRWWDAEERERRALLAATAAALPEHPLMSGLTWVAEAASDVVHGAAAVAAARAGIADAALIRVAAGAATLACYQAGLARAAGRGDAHPFAVKLRVFEGGRWMLGIVGGVCFVF